jgi:DNA-binding MarR family transcriptional regulator
MAAAKGIAKRAERRYGSEAKPLHDPASMPALRSDSFGSVINYLGRLFARALERRIQRYGLHPGQLPALAALWEREGISQAELCRIVQVEQPTMANTLNRMERDNLIRRRPDPQDRRRALVFLTERARALEADVTAEARRVNAIAIGTLSPEEQAELERLLDKLTGNLERELGF